MLKRSQTRRFAAGEALEVGNVRDCIAYNVHVLHVHVLLQHDDTIICKPFEVPDSHVKQNLPCQPEPAQCRVEFSIWLAILACSFAVRMRA